MNRRSIASASVTGPVFTSAPVSGSVIHSAFCFFAWSSNDWCFCHQSSLRFCLYFSSCFWFCQYVFYSRFFGNTSAPVSGSAITPVSASVSGAVITLRSVSTSVVTSFSIFGYVNTSNAPGYVITFASAPVSGTFLIHFLIGFQALSQRFLLLVLS